MNIKTIAIQSPGDMGHGIGRLLVEGGYRVVSALEGRSERTKTLSQEAGIEDVGDIDNLFDSVDVILSIMRPDKALGFIKTLARKATLYPSRPVIVDLNAISPNTGKNAAQKARSVGLEFIDGGIIGGPPRAPKNESPRLYVSGPNSEELTSLNATGLDFRSLGNEIGSASAIKMSYAAMTKGLTAIAINSMIIAKLEGVEDAFAQELHSSQPNLFNHMKKWLPDMCPKAYRWVGEMEEIAKTFDDSNLSEKLFHGVAETYMIVEKSILGEEIVEKRKKGKTAEDVTDILASFVSQN
jgi:3-hydroxyisobutyrate dehydrogenase-like beta-hydroxyacid dehydrogenase